jgi:hypothetical protein
LALTGGLAAGFAALLTGLAADLDPADFATGFLAGAALPVFLAGALAAGFPEDFLVGIDASVLL